VAIALLIAANLVPLVGVALLGWDLATLVAIYWAENGVVGIFAIGRIATAAGFGPAEGRTGPPARVARDDPTQPPPPPRGSLPAFSPGAMAGAAIVGRILMIPFFIVHYGIFWAVHGVFVWSVLPGLFAGMGGGAIGFGDAFAGPDSTVVVAAAGALFLSHGASFLLNWIGGGEYRSSSAVDEMQAPYGRVVILHLTILFGAFAVAILGAPVGALLVMVVLKTGVDLAAHLAERRRAEARRGSVGSGSAPVGLDAPLA
jgi:hypothetical protein